MNRPKESKTSDAGAGDRPVDDSQAPAAAANPMEMTKAADEESPEEKRLRWKRERHRALGGTD
jgi:hypothetical protein